MRILIVNWQDITNPLAGGAEVHLHEVFERIAALGHEVTLFCSGFPGAPREEDRRGLHIIREGGRYLFNFRFAWRWLTRLRLSGFDIVVDDMNKIPFFTPLLVGRTVHGLTHHLFGKSIFLEVNVVLASYVFLMESLAVSLYRRMRVPFIVGSPSTRQELLARKFPASDIVLIPYGVDHARHVPGTAKDPAPLIGYFGRLKRYKSVDHLLQSLPAVAARVPGLRVVIVGDGDDKPRLMAMAQELGVAPLVSFTGFVSEEEKIRILQRLWCCVTTSSKEGWGLTVIEANACGTPVVASRVEGLRDAVKDGETGLLFEYGDVPTLSGKILDVLTDARLRERLTHNAIAWAARFDWDTAAADTLRCLQVRCAPVTDPANA